MTSPTPTTPSPIPARFHNLLAVLFMAAVGIGFGLLMIALLILLFPNLEPGGQHFIFTEYDGDTFRHQPGLVRPPAENRVLEDLVRFDDADGFRRPAMTADHYPIIAIGDSFTDGGQVPWVDVLAADLNTPVRNLGWSGFGPLEYAAIAEQYGGAGHEWVLVMFFEGNDLSNTYTTWTKAQETDGAVQLNLTRSIAPPITELRTLAQYGDITLNPDNWYLYPLTHPNPGGGGEPYEIAYLSDYVWWLNGDAATYRESRNVQELQNALSAIVSASGDACVALVYAPNKEHIYFPLSDPDGNRKYVLENALTLTVKDDGWLGFDTPRPQEYDTLAARLNNQRDVIGSTAEAVGMQFIDLVPAFENAALSDAPAYYAYDSHWNERGHQIAGETVADYLRANPCQSS